MDNFSPLSLPPTGKSIERWSDYGGRTRRSLSRQFDIDQSELDRDDQKQNRVEIHVHDLTSLHIHCDRMFPVLGHFGFRLDQFLSCLRKIIPVSSLNSVPRIRATGFPIAPMLYLPVQSRSAQQRTFRPFGG
jgi:hypothetical protein